MSGRASRDKGARYEREIVKYLNEHGYPNAERKLAGKTDDTGDINAGPPDITLELKNHKRYDLSGWLDEAVLEALHAGNSYGVVVIRRDGSVKRDADYCVMRLCDLVELTREKP